MIVSAEAVTLEMARATVLPADGTSSVVVVEGESMLRLPFVWIADGGSNQGLVERIKRALPLRVTQAVETMFAGAGCEWNGHATVM